MMVCIPLRTSSGLNAREHWRARTARVRKEREADRKDIRGVRDFQIWLTGALAAAAFFFGLFATEIKKALGL